ncbi:MAG TPA: hypothetical protein VGM41_16580 [Chitinophagaceae bacterium]|jgi:hypothetical protein
MENNSSGQSQTAELRKVMFDQIRRLNNPDLDLDKELKRANAITSVGNVIVNSVKVELDFVRVTRQVPGKNGFGSKGIEDSKPAGKTKQLGHGK